MSRLKDAAQVVLRGNIDSAPVEADDGAVRFTMAVSVHLIEDEPVSVSVRVRVARNAARAALRLRARDRVMVTGHLLPARLNFVEVYAVEIGRSL